MKRLHDLDGYVTGELTGADADAFEEAMFDAPDDPDVELLDRFSRLGAKLAAHGTFDMGVPRTRIDDLRAQGIKVQIIQTGAPSTTPETLALDTSADLICTRLDIGRTDLDYVDVELTLVAYNATKVMKDALVDRSEGVLYGLCERALAETAWGHGKTIVRVREPHGDRAVIAEWNFLGTLLPASP